MTSSDIRQSFLDYFEKHGHARVSSGSLVPADDPTLLFTNAGMNQFKDLFLGKEQRGYQRAATSQKCMRVSGKHNDLNNVGPSLRHHTFFEMLGNFSFGDYFKDEAIPFAWTLLTDVWKIPQERLYATIFRGEGDIDRDDEALAIWKTLVPNNHIIELGLGENFWSMGDTGPCGRCSELHYHRGDDLPCQEPTCRGIDCSCDRYVEVWNNVFMEFNRDAAGVMTPLPAPSIDTGMGLERITSVLQGKISNYDTDLFTPLLAAIEDVSETKYQPVTSVGALNNDNSDTSMRVVADHMRAMTFLIADGVLPSNEWRGYVLRKIMRRAMRHGKKLGMTEPFLYRLVDIVVQRMGTPYPELQSERNSIANIIQHEEERFDAVLTDGLPRLERILATSIESPSKQVDGKEAFRLYDTYGLPLDFIEDLASERGLRIDRSSFDNSMNEQREQSRSGRVFETSNTSEFTYHSDEAQRLLQSIGDSFDGYLHISCSDIPLIALFDSDRKQVRKLNEGETGHLILERTPFYLESGGQVSDEGYITSDKGEAVVEAMTRLSSAGPRVHSIRVVSGNLSMGERVTARVNQTTRDSTRRNHTATHLLHAALRTTLGSHVKQAGSLVDPDRLRFDFSHFEPITSDELATIERQVNQQIYANHLVETTERRTDDAIADGAMALFGEKYGDNVRVVNINDISMELCGGTHCEATGEIGPFVITQENGIAAGVRRIDALTGEGALSHLHYRSTALNTILGALVVPVDQAVEAVQRLQHQVKNQVREIEQLKIKAAMGGQGQGNTQEVLEIDGFKVVTRQVNDLERDSLRILADSIRDTLGASIVILASARDAKVSLLISVTKDLVGRVHAGQLVKALAPIIGGRGGGRQDFAEAGGQFPDKVGELFIKSRATLNQLLTDAS